MLLLNAATNALALMILLAYASFQAKLFVCSSVVGECLIVICFSTAGTLTQQGGSLRTTRALDAAFTPHLCKCSSVGVESDLNQSRASTRPPAPPRLVIFICTIKLLRLQYDLPRNAASEISSMVLVVSKNNISSCARYIINHVV